MKFTDGYWQMRPGHQAFYPVQAYEIETGRDSLTVHAAAKKNRISHHKNFPITPMEAFLDELVRYRNPYRMK